MSSDSTQNPLSLPNVDTVMRDPQAGDSDIDMISASKWFVLDDEVIVTLAIPGSDSVLGEDLLMTEIKKLASSIDAVSTSVENVSAGVENVSAGVENVRAGVENVRAGVENLGIKSTTSRRSCSRGSRISARPWSNRSTRTLRS